MRMNRLGSHGVHHVTLESFIGTDRSCVVLAWLENAESKDAVRRGDPGACFSEGMIHVETS